MWEMCSRAWPNNPDTTCLGLAGLTPEKRPGVVDWGQCRQYINAYIYIYIKYYIYMYSFQPHGGSWISLPH